MKQEKEQANLLVDQIRSKMESSEDSKKEMNMRLMASESEFNKQKALLGQQIEFLKNTLGEASGKESKLQEEISEQKKEYLEGVKLGSSRFELQIKELNEQKEDLGEQLANAEREIEDVNQKYQLEKSSRVEFESKLKTKGSQSQSDYLELETKVKALKQELELQEETIKKDFEADLNEFKDLNELLQQQVLDLNSKTQTYSVSVEKETALLDQKIDFLETQLIEAKV